MLGKRSTEMYKTQVHIWQVLVHVMMRIIQASWGLISERNVRKLPPDTWTLRLKCSAHFLIDIILLNRVNCKTKHFLTPPPNPWVMKLNKALFILIGEGKIPCKYICFFFLNHPLVWKGLLTTDLTGPWIQGLSKGTRSPGVQVIAKWRNTKQDYNIFWYIIDPHTTNLHFHTHTQCQIYNVK